MTRRFSVLLAVFLLICLAGLRFAYIGRLSVHNDERHFALDGMWVHAELPVSAVLWDVLYCHVHPHPFYNPSTHELGYHGKLEAGYFGAADDLGPYPRVGHPCLYMLVLGSVLALMPEQWLLANDQVVQVARGLNIVLDVATLALLFDLLRRHFHRALAIGLTAALALWPYTFVLGSLAYLDAAGCFLVTLAVWYYAVAVRTTSRYRAWALLGAIASASVLVKQTNLVVVPILVGFALQWPPMIARRRLLASVVASLGTAILTFILLCHPVAFNREARYPTDPTTSTKPITAVWVASQFSFPFMSDQHYGFKESAGKPAWVPDPIVVTIYRWSTPTFFAAFAAASLALMVARRWRFALLIATVIAFTILVPYGTILRRLATIVPCIALGIA